MSAYINDFSYVDRIPEETLSDVEAEVKRLRITLAAVREVLVEIRAQYADTPHLVKLVDAILDREGES